MLPIVATEEDGENGDSKANQEIKSPVIQSVIIMEEDSKERRDIAQPIVHNIFGTNGEDDYSVHDMLNNHQPMAEIGSTYAIPIATKDERVKEQEIRQSIVHNIFGTNTEDDDSVNDMLNNHQPMAEIGEGSTYTGTYTIPIATKKTKGKKTRDNTANGA